MIHVEDHAEHCRMAREILIITVPSRRGETCFTVSFRRVLKISATFEFYRHVRLRNYTPVVPSPPAPSTFHLLIIPSRLVPCLFISPISKSKLSRPAIILSHYDSHLDNPCFVSSCLTARNSDLGSHGRLSALPP